MDPIASMLEWLKTYGVATVLLAILLVIIVWQALDQHKRAEAQRQRDKEQDQKEDERDKSEAQREEQFSNQMQELYDVMLSHSSEAGIKDKKDEHRNAALGTYISTQLQGLREQTGANRCDLYMFHNGTGSINGLIKFYKVSVINESIDPNTKPLLGNYHDIPAQVLQLATAKLGDPANKDRGYYIDDIESIKATDSQTYYMFSEKGVKSLYMQSIFDEKGIMLGFVTAEFVSSKPIMEPKPMKRAMWRASEKISGAFGTTDDKEEEEYINNGKTKSH